MQRSTLPHLALLPLLLASCASAPPLRPTSGASPPHVLRATGALSGIGVFAGRWDVGVEVRDEGSALLQFAPGCRLSAARATSRQPTKGTYAFTPSDSCDLGAMLDRSERTASPPFVVQGGTVTIAEDGSVDLVVTGTDFNAREVILRFVGLLVQPHPA